VKIYLRMNESCERETSQCICQAKIERYSSHGLETVSALEWMRFHVDVRSIKIHVSQVRMDQFHPYMHGSRRHRDRTSRWHFYRCTPGPRGARDRWGVSCSDAARSSLVPDEKRRKTFAADLSSHDIRTCTGIHVLVYMYYALCRLSGLI